MNIITVHRPHILLNDFFFSNSSWTLQNRYTILGRLRQVLKNSVIFCRKEMFIFKIFGFDRIECYFAFLAKAHLHTRIVLEY